ncbi:hypothetical protein KI387_020394, partial [Taxus chinensis]
TWVIGKWAGYRDQMWAPAGTVFHQFTVAQIIEFRKDCTYRDSIALLLPPSAKGVNGCEYTLRRRAVYACHAGGVVHALQGYPDHEVGAIDVHRIDTLWNAALHHGFMPLPHSHYNYL